MNVIRILNGINHLHSFILFMKATFNELMEEEKTWQEDQRIIKKRRNCTGFVKNANSQHAYAFSCYVVCKTATNKCWIEDEKHNLYNIKRTKSFNSLAGFSKKNFEQKNITSFESFLQ